MGFKGVGEQKTNWKLIFANIGRGNALAKTAPTCGDASMRLRGDPFFLTKRNSHVGRVERCSLASANEGVSKGECD
jgi:hypothetical protein